MSEALEAYRQLETRLVQIIDAHNGDSCLEEDEVLDQMEMLWYDLTTEEQTLLRKEGLVE